jgi:hypothetical protein
MVGPLTWRDAAAGWPSPLMEDRGQVVEPDSVGVAVRKDGQGGTSSSLAAGGLTLSTGPAVLRTSR